MLDEFDVDGNGTMDFVEFMILIYRFSQYIHTNRVMNCASTAHVYFFIFIRKKMYVCIPWLLLGFKEMP